MRPVQAMHYDLLQDNYAIMLFYGISYAIVRSYISSAIMLLLT